MELFVDKVGKQFITGKAAPTPLGTVRLGENIIEPVTIWLLDRAETSGEPLTAAALDAAFSGLVLAGRPQADLELPDLLFSVDDFTEVGTGDDLHYEGLLSLNTVAIQTALVGLKTLSIFLEVEAIGVAPTRNSRLTPHASAVLLRDIYRGDEGAPEESNPLFYSAAQVDALLANMPTVLTAITGLTGGGSSKLDGIEQADMVNGKVIMLPNAGDALIWQQKRIAIATSSAANPSTITTSTPHGLTTGQTPAIGGHSTAAINSASVAVTVLSSTTFTVAALGGGTGGYVTPAEDAAGGIVRPDDFAATSGLFFASVL